MYPKIEFAKIRSLPKFCGKTCQFYFKQQTTKHISKCVYEIENINQCEKRIYPGLLVLSPGFLSIAYRQALKQNGHNKYCDNPYG
jgi:hypothetical protein